MSKVVIIGNGPAGISASLYTIRAGIETIVIGKDSGSLGKASEIENYYGFSEPISGKDLVNQGLEGARRLGVQIISDEVLGITFNNGLSVVTKNGEYSADALVIATGSNRNTPKIKGVKELEGQGVSYCAICDAFFYRGKDVSVLGNGNYALHEAMALTATSKSVTILTDGKEPEFDVPENIIINKNKIASVDGNEIIEKISFENGETLPTSGLFVAIGVAGSTELAKKLGIATEGNNILKNENMATNIPGVYAIGDCTGGLLQVSKAVYEGAKAGTEIVKYLRNK